MSGRVLVAWGGSLLLAACLDASNVARSDQSPALLAVEDSLGREHFGGLVVVERPSAEVLRLRFRDAGRCGDAVDSLPPFALEAAARAMALYRAPALQSVAPIARIDVAFTRTHRFGVLVWTTPRGRFSFPAERLRQVTVAPPPACGSLPHLLRTPHG